MERKFEKTVKKIRTRLIEEGFPSAGRQDSFDPKRGVECIKALHSLHSKARDIRQVTQRVGRATIELPGVFSENY